MTGDIYMSCALEGEANYIISGDHHLKELTSFQGMRIVDPATFLAIINAPPMEKK